ncbi:helix-turn-helix domain-containing protein [Micromonospora sp. DT44]|uniref:helix-turn-helix domain-containing protein n=1 Tax=Micromonospora sp. DT44 TaxID=3393439 RepID=UPI003CE73B68
MAERGPAYAFWARVKAEQATRGWTDSELFRRSGVTRNTINGLKTRERVTASTVNDLADALEIPRDEAHKLAGLVPADDEPDGEAANAREAILRDPIYNDEQRAAMLQLHDLFARANRPD